MRERDLPAENAYEDTVEAADVAKLRIAIVQTRPFPLKDEADRADSGYPLRRE